MSRGMLRPDLQRSHIAMDSLPDRAVVIDGDGSAWQKSGYLGLWYRAFDGNGTSSFEVAQRGPVRVVEGGEGA